MVASQDGIFHGCCNKRPQAWWLEATRIHPRSVRWVRRPAQSPWGETGLWQAAPLLDTLGGDSPPGSSSSQRRPHPGLVAPRRLCRSSVASVWPASFSDCLLLHFSGPTWAHLDGLPVSRSAYQQPYPSPRSMTRSWVPGLRTGPHLGRWSVILPTTQSHRPRFTRMPSNSRRCPPSCPLGSPPGSTSPVQRLPGSPASLDLLWAARELQ